MKHFLLLSIVCFHSLYLFGQNTESDTICDNLKFFISKPELMYEEEITSLIENNSIDICNDTNSIYLKAVSDVESRMIKTYLDPINLKDSILVNNNDTYNFLYFTEDNMPNICFDKSLTINFKDNIEIIYVDIRELPYKNQDTILFCIMDSLVLKAKPNVNDTTGFKFEWILDAEVFNEDSVILYSENAQTSVAILTFTDSDGCTLNKDTLILQSYEPPNVSALDTIRASNCKGFGSLSFQIDNTSEGLDLEYKIFNIKKQTTDTYNETIISNLAIGEYELQVSYKELEGCAVNIPFSITSNDTISLKLNLEKKDYCVGDNLTITSTKSDLVTAKYWSKKNSSDNIFIRNETFDLRDEYGIELKEQDIGKFFIKLQYNYVGNMVDCDSEVIDSIFVYPNPKPLIISEPDESAVCPSTELKLKVEELEGYTYEWKVLDNNDQIVEDKDTIPSTFSFEELAAEQTYTYSVIVTSEFQCSEFFENSIEVKEGVAIVFPKDIMQKDTICYGAKVLYANGSELIINQNFVFPYSDRDISIIQWFEGGIFSDNRNSECNKLDITIINDILPDGRIEPFGSDKFIFADENGVAAYENIEYQWFYIDLKEGKDSIYNNATERLIDCNASSNNCLFKAKEESKILGLNVSLRNCTNLIFYDQHNFFAGLVGINESENTNPFNLYPNLNQGTFNIQLSKPPTEPNSLAIYNVVGELVWLNKLTNQTTQRINLPNKETGVYFAVLKQNNHAIAQHKFIIH